MHSIKWEVKNRVRDKCSFKRSDESVELGREWGLPESMLSRIGSKSKYWRLFALLLRLFFEFKQQSQSGFAL